MDIKAEIKQEYQKVKIYWEGLSQKEKIIIAIFSIIIPIFLYTRFFFLPGIEKIQKLNNEKRNLQIQIKTYKKQQIKFKLLEKQENQLKNILETAKKLLPQKTEISELLSNIAQESKKFDLTIISFQAKPEIITENFYAIIPIDLVVEGNFHNIILFLDSLRFQKRILIPKGLKLKAGKVKNIVKEKNSYKLTAECKIYTYRLLTKQEIDQFLSKKKTKKK